MPKLLKSLKLSPKKIIVNSRGEGRNSSEASSRQCKKDEESVDDSKDYLVTKQFANLDSSKKKFSILSKRKTDLSSNTHKTDKILNLKLNETPKNLALTTESETSSKASITESLEAKSTVEITISPKSSVMRYTGGIGLLRIQDDNMAPISLKIDHPFKRESQKAEHERIDETPDLRKKLQEREGSKMDVKN
ncbi:hypothetical protein Avbf_14597 [Armadillidium vulgare]|nr:hypothetical protein Avbf_14597 [Armadillidium vulgare]